MRKINKLKILKTLQNKTKRIVFSITNWDKSYFIFTWLLFLFFCFSIQAKDWSDLDEGEKKDVYGSEKRKNIPQVIYFLKSKIGKNITGFAFSICTIIRIIPNTIRLILFHFT